MKGDEENEEGRGAVRPVGIISPLSMFVLLLSIYVCHSAWLR